MRDFLRRAAFAVVAIPLAAWIVWMGGWVLAGLLALLAGRGAWEFYRLAEATGVRPFNRTGIALAAAVPLVVHTNFEGFTRVPLSAGAIALIVIFAAGVVSRSGERPLGAIGATVLGVLYTGGLFSYAYAIRYNNVVVDAAGGVALLGLPLLLTWATDTGGYVFGRLWGKAKLAPTVSPGKTIVGAFGGLALAVVAAAAYVAYVLHPHANLAMTPVGLGVFAVLVSASAQVGDLAESLVKREAGVKDSSNIIPGHGGVLDRFDSTLFVLPVAFVLFAELLVAVP